MGCSQNGCCETVSALRREADSVTVEQRRRALVACYAALDLAVREGNDAVARGWQREINRIEGAEQK